MRIITNPAMFSRTFLRHRPQDIRLQKRLVDRIIPFNTLVSPPVPRSSEFQTHIYNFFLRGRTTDVTLRICASWDAIYNCYCVALIRAVRTCSARSGAPFAYIPSKKSFAIFLQEGLLSRIKDSSGSCTFSGSIQVISDYAKITRPFYVIALPEPCESPPHPFRRLSQLSSTFTSGLLPMFYDLPGCVDYV